MSKGWDSRQGSDVEGGRGEGENSPYVVKHRSSTPLGPLPKTEEGENVLGKEGNEVADELGIWKEDVPCMNGSMGES